MLWASQSPEEITLDEYEIFSSDLPILKPYQKSATMSSSFFINSLRTPPHSALIPQPLSLLLGALPAEQERRGQLSARITDAGEYFYGHAGIMSSWSDSFLICADSTFFTA